MMIAGVCFLLAVMGFVSLGIMWSWVPRAERPTTKEIKVSHEQKLEMELDNLKRENAALVKQVDKTIYR